MALQSPSFFFAGVKAVGFTERGVLGRGIVQVIIVDLPLNVGKSHLLSRNPQGVTVAHVDDFVSQVKDIRIQDTSLFTWVDSVLRL